MMDRKDFTNFLVFYNQNKAKEELVTKTLSYEPTIPQVLVTDEYKGGEKKDNVNRFVLRFVYSLIYLLETEVIASQKKAEAPKKSQEEAKSEEPVQEPVQKEEPKVVPEPTESKQSDPTKQTEEPVKNEQVAGAKKEEEDLYKIQG